jgi:hypothetical protein
LLLYADDLKIQNLTSFFSSIFRGSSSCLDDGIPHLAKDQLFHDATMHKYCSMGIALGGLQESLYNDGIRLAYA